ncbi:hypothetical protein T458_05365 [Brevibacillus panacihumi W25]|uniref:PRTRC system protein B n=1 Tax=Brevibacillus panacihumi W25 TaxID=1408254 RepID=V6MJY5_9BACL|nr:hypothetical protein [Brevibacillus panacihumi]EST55758.1 hypothetical protein T458_05365 [Brevibacillus panacihumi W25]
MPRYIVQFNDDFSNGTPYCQIKVTQGETVLEEFEMSFDDFAEAIMDSRMKSLKPQKIMGMVKRKRLRSIVGKRRIPNPLTRIETPTLPVNCVKHIWINRIKREQIVFVEIPKQQWNTSYYNTSLEMVGFPRMLFGYRIRGQEITSLYIFAVKEKGRIKGDTELFKFPFANVSNGLVCMGGNIFPEITDLAQLSTLHNIFFTAPSSSCYFSEGRNLSGISDLRELYTSLQRKDFPDEWLQTKQITFAECCKRF